MDSCSSNWLDCCGGCSSGALPDPFCGHGCDNMHVQGAEALARMRDMCVEAEERAVAAERRLAVADARCVPTAGFLRRPAMCSAPMAVLCALSPTTANSEASTSQHPRCFTAQCTCHAVWATDTFTQGIQSGGGCAGGTGSGKGAAESHAAGAGARALPAHGSALCCWVQAVEHDSPRLSAYANQSRSLLPSTCLLVSVLMGACSTWVWPFHTHEPACHSHRSSTYRRSGTL